MTAKEALKELCNYVNDDDYFNYGGGYYECKTTLETALNRLEELEKENKELKERYAHSQEMRECFFKQKNEWKYNYLELEKVLKIIKERTDIGVVILGDEPHLRTFDKSRLRFYGITETEFNLLKEYLK